jgi:cytochrome c553
MDYVGLGILIILALLFGFLTYRAARARRGWVKLAGGVPAGLLTLIFGAATVLAFVGYGKINAQRPNPVPQMTAQMSPELIANGERFARACAGCHSSNGELPLAGQDFFGEGGGPPMGTLWAPNLTQAHLEDWTDGEIVRAIREGVKKDGTSTLIMPSGAFRNLSDEDVLALVAYLRSQPPVEPRSPPRQFNVLGAILLATVIPDDIFTAQAPITEQVVAPPRGPTAEYGGYLIHFGCQDCHGENLAGMPASEEGSPGGPNLTAVSQRFTEEQFVTLLRTGTYPDGRRLSEDMPWKDFEKLSDDDFRALYAHLASLEELPNNE